MRLLYAAGARAQIESIHSYIAQYNPLAATMVVSRIRAATERLVTYPRMGRIGTVSGTFEWLVRGLPYVIVYELPNEESIVVLNVFHAAQDRTMMRRER